MDFTIRAATKQDCDDILRMITELAAYEKMSDQVMISQQGPGPRTNMNVFKAFYLERDGFGPKPRFECLVVEVPEEHRSNDGFTVVGYALYFYTYSTWRGPCIHLEDLYVMPDQRGNGFGKGLLVRVAQIAKEKTCARLQLSALEWNTPSRDFYAAKGAQDLTASEGWHLLRFDGASLDDLAKQAAKG